MFKKSAAALKAAAIKSESKANAALAKAQVNQAQAVKQATLAAEVEECERLAYLEKDAIASRLALTQATMTYIAAVGTEERAASAYDVAKRATTSAEEIRQAAAKDYSQARSRVNTAKAALKRVSTND